MVEVDPAAWCKVIDVNLNGSFCMSHVFGCRLIEKGEGGAIIHISSVGAKLMAPNTAAYAASKAAVHALTAEMAGEAGRYGIRVHAICPGIVTTSRLDGLSPAQWDAIIDTHVPLKRAGAPAEIASMVVHPCSTQGAWVSGQIYSVDGGQAAGR